MPVKFSNDKFSMRRVLIVDDELPILTGLSKALHELCDFRGDIRTVVNGREAVNETGCCYYDVCFLDIKLPDINGFDVMKEIQDHSPETRIILMSGSYLQGDLSGIADDEEIFYIEKPFKFVQIKDVMNRALEDYGNYFTGRISEMDGKRKHKRKPLTKTISFHVNDSEYMDFRAGAIDVSSSGVGLETYYPLEKGHIITFGKELSNRKGIVVWSYNRKEYNYRAGIKFI